MVRLAADVCLWLCCAAFAWAGDGIDLAKVPRTAPKTPTLVAARPLYGIYLFGQRGEKVVWAILDKSTREAPVYDLLYLDLNADGDLTRAEERFRGAQPSGSPSEPPQCRFEIGRFVEPGSQRAHTEFVITWRPTRVSYQMKWLGGSSPWAVTGLSRTLTETSRPHPRRRRFSCRATISPFASSTG
jgi:hypothetical protein